MPESIDSQQQSTEKEIDTDLPENRLKRAVNHYNFELTDLSHTIGMSFKDRFVSIRSSLFRGFSNISGEDHNRLLSEGRVLSDSRAQIHDEFMPSNEAAEAALEGLMPMVDAWYRDIQAMPEGQDKQDTVYRMLSAMFVGGVLIHPARDGNGQTFKGLALSYLHDLLPDHRDRFIPIKYDQAHHDLGHEMAIAFMGGGRSVSKEEDLISGDVPGIETDNPSILRLLEYAGKAKELHYQDNDKRDIDKEVVDLVSKAQHELGIDNLLEYRVYRWEETRSWFRKTRRPVHTPPFVAFMDGCAKYLESQGFNPENISVSLNNGSNMKLDRSSSAVRRLFATQQGRKVLSDYVMTGTAQIGEEDTLTNELFRKAVKMIGRQKDNLVKTLETKEEHDRRHQEMMQQPS